jgi:GMP synthase-like glutamine amidotransferase
MRRGLNVLRKSEYNNYRTSHLFFYNFNKKNDLNFLFYEDLNNLKLKKNEFKANISLFENVPNITAARVMSSDFFGLFSKKNIESILNKKELTIEDLEANFKKNSIIPWYRLKQSSSFREWATKLAYNPIQLDSIEGKQIYFEQIPEIDVEFLNNNLSELQYPYRFSFNKINSTDISEDTKEILSSVDVETFLVKENLKSLKPIKEENVIILSCEPCTEGSLENMFYTMVFPGIWRKNHEKWLCFHTHKGEFPSEEELKDCKALFIPGSSISAYVQDSHVLETIKWLRKFVQNKNHNKTKILAICFGHQIFSHALGGLAQARQPRNSVDIIESIQVKDDFWDLNFVKELNFSKRKEFKIPENHGDEVTSLSPLLKHYGSSPSCENEICVSPDERFFTMQCHPDYTAEHLFWVLHSIIYSEEQLNKFIESGEIEIMKNKFLEGFLSKNKEMDYDFRAIIQNFLK